MNVPARALPKVQMNVMNAMITTAKSPAHA
jgi:hypothetical protein